LGNHYSISRSPLLNNPQAFEDSSATPAVALVPWLTTQRSRGFDLDSSLNRYSPFFLTKNQLRTSSSLYFLSFICYDFVTFLSLLAIYSFLS